MIVNNCLFKLNIFRFKKKKKNHCLDSFNIRSWLHKLNYLYSQTPLTCLVAITYVHVLVVLMLSYIFQYFMRYVIINKTKTVQITNSNQQILN